MGKKNKALEVTEKEVTLTYKGATCTASEFYLDKKCLGQVITLEHGFEAVTEPEKNTMKVKNFQDGVEFLLREWNLHQ